MGIEAGTFIMLGYPGETEEDILETLEYLKEANPDLATYTVSYPIKGTALYQELEGQLINQKDWQKSTDREIEFRRTYPNKYYRYALPWLINSFELYKRKMNGKSFGLEVIKLFLLTKVLRVGMLIYRRQNKQHAV
ncbi:MAG: hypothetical protein IPL46_09300 [Saprospiraceae bacterium]|nr:hypothetical protein [Saprospiraceae bacterium]